MNIIVAPLTGITPDPDNDLFPGPETPLNQHATHLALRLMHHRLRLGLENRLPSDDRLTLSLLEVCPDEAEATLRHAQWLANYGAGIARMDREDFNKDQERKLTWDEALQFYLDWEKGEMGAGFQCGTCTDEELRPHVLWMFTEGIRDHRRHPVVAWPEPKPEADQKNLLELIATSRILNPDHIGQGMIVISWADSDLLDLYHQVIWAISAPAVEAFVRAWKEYAPPG